MRQSLIIVGAGITGLTIAEHVSREYPTCHVQIVDKAEHIGGSVFDYKDPVTDIIIHEYGPHIFHTSDTEVWEYLNRFTQFNDYRHKVLAVHDDVYYPMPINLTTINKLFTGMNLDSAGAEQFIKHLAEQATAAMDEPFTDAYSKGLSLVGEELFNTFIANYSAKQWGVPMSELPASVIERLPVRFNENDRYFNDTHEGLPVNGYTEMLKAMLNGRRNIQLTLETDFCKGGPSSMRDNTLAIGIPTVFTGPVDAFYDNKHGLLQYRTLEFQTSRYIGAGDMQPTAVVNHVDADVPYTRTTDYKQFYPETAQFNRNSVIVKEFSREGKPGDNLFYPVNSEHDKLLMKRYRNEMESYDSRNVLFAGRLGAYSYINMDVAVRRAIDLYNSNIKPFLDGRTSNLNDRSM